MNVRGLIFVVVEDDIWKFVMGLYVKSDFFNCSVIILKEWREWGNSVWNFNLIVNMWVKLWKLCLMIGGNIVWNVVYYFRVVFKVLCVEWGGLFGIFSLVYDICSWLGVKF